MKIAIFDFDGTLFNNETIPFLTKQWLKLGYSKRKWAKIFSRLVGLLLKYKSKLDKELTKEKFRGTATEIFLSIFEEMNKDEIEEFFEKCAPEIMIHLNTDVISEFKKRKEEGYYTILLSGCFKEMLNKITDVYKFDKVVCTNLEYKDDKLIVDGRLDIVSGESKLVNLKRHIDLDEVDLQNSYSYGDSLYDRYVLEIVGNPIVVNPDSGLMDLAQKNSWKLLKNV